jgi:formyl-CoA transferase
MLTVSSPFWIDGQEKVAPRHAPRVGEHSDEVLQAAGYDQNEIGKMRAAGIVG